MVLDALPILLAFFWVGFSLAYVVTSWFARLLPQFGSKLRGRAVSFPVRLVMTLVALSGALGTAALLGTHRMQSPGIDIAFLTGAALGLGVSYVLHFRKSVNADAI